MRKLLLLCFILCSFILFSQEKKEQEFNKIKEKYDQLKSFSMDVSVSLYASHQSNEIIEKEEFNIASCKSKFYSQQFGIETIIAEGYNLIIDHGDNTIFVSAYDQADTSKAEKIEIPTQMMDSLLMVLGVDSVITPEITYEKLENKNGMRVLYYSLNYSQYESVKLEYDSDYIVRQLTLFYRNEQPIVASSPAKPRVEMSFSNILLHCSEENLFSINRYVNIPHDLKKITPQAKYKGYFVVNQLEANP